MFILPIAFTSFTTPQPEQVDELEPLFKQRLSALPYRSPRFDSELKKVLKTAKAELRWEPVFGPTKIGVADVSLGGTTEGTIVFWSIGKHTGVQLLDSLQSTHSKPGLQHSSEDFVYGEAYRKGGRLVRCGYSNDGVNYVWPIVTTYALRQNCWEVVASLNDSNVYDALPGTRFSRRNGTVDPTHVIAMLGVYPTYLEQPHAAPHLVYRQVWTVRGNSITRGPRHLIPTATSELDHLSNLAKHAKRAEFNAHVPARYQKKLWKYLQAPVGAVCNGNLQYDYGKELLCDHESSRKSLLLNFERKHGGYRLIKMRIVENARA